MSGIRFEVFSPEEYGLQGVRPRPRIAFDLDTLYCWPTALGSGTSDLRGTSYLGDTITTVRRQKASVRLGVRFLPAEIARLVEQLHYQRRPIYLNANAGLNTHWSYPLTRSLQGILGPSLQATPRAVEGYQWEAESKVLHEYTPADPVIGYGGPYSRYLKTSKGTINLMVVRKPSSATTMFTLTAGTGISKYQPDHLSPLLADQDPTRGTVGGLWELSADAQGTIPDFTATLNAPSAGADGRLVLYGQGVGRWLATVGATNQVLDGTGQMERYDIALPNMQAADTTLLLQPLEVLNTPQTMFVGPTTVTQQGGTTHGFPAADDLHGGAASSDLISVIGPNNPITSGWTISFLYRNRPYDQGFLSIGDVAANHFVIQKTATSGDGGKGQFEIGKGPSPSATFGAISDMYASADPNDDQWHHFVCTLETKESPTNGEVRLYIDGQEHPSGPATGNVFQHNLTGEIRVGSAGNAAYFTESAGICLVRLDLGVATPAQAKSHFDTYMDERGRAFSRLLMGREYLLDAPQLTGMNVDGSEMYEGELLFREERLLPEIAALQQMELI